VPAFRPARPSGVLQGSSTRTAARQQRPERSRARTCSLRFHHRFLGLVVTNNHVIADADEITVILHDDTS